MRIDGDLDLNNAEIKFPLRAGMCAFSGDVLLQFAQLKGFYLFGCLIKSLNASGANIRGAVLLRDGFETEGEVNLMRATIGGDLDCTGVQLSNPKGTALSAEGTKVGGSVFLTNGFKAKGEVDLMGATIGGDLDCTGAQLSNPKGTALSAEGTKVGGSVFLRNAFKAEGEVDLMGATIGGNLDCVGAQLSNPKGTALIADGTKIGGNVFLRNGFKAEGEVRLVGATIGGDLDCTGAQLSNPEGRALRTDGTKIGRRVFLTDAFKAEGKVRLVGATIRELRIVEVLEAEQTILDLRFAEVGTFWDDEKSWPKAGNLRLDGFRYERLYEESPLQADSRIKWLRRQPPDKFLPQPYEQLAAVLRQMGHEGDAWPVMIEKNRERARFTHFPRHGWWWYNVFGRLIDYGYAPWRAFAISVAMILLGTFLFHLGRSHDLVTPAKENAYAKAPNGQFELDKSERPKIVENYPVFNALVYSTESFIPLIKFDQTANWTPNANRCAKISIFHRQVPFSGRFLRCYLYCHIAAGWLLTSLWVGAVTGLVKT